MTADREFLSTTGTRHRHAPNVCVIRIHGVAQYVAACNQSIEGDDLVVQQPLTNCRRCYPKGRTE